MSLPLLAVAFAALLVLGYRSHGARVARNVGLDAARPTPARRLADGRDFVAARPFYLFAQHFSAIAAAGPIAGPILACQLFGWLPCLLWIGIGAILVGAVHDFSVLAASLRHEGRSITEIARARIGPGAGRALLAFVWIALVYVIVAFADITAGTFVAGSEELREAAAGFHPGGAVAAASALYLLVAVAMGAAQRALRISLPLATLVFVPAGFAAAWAGTWVSDLLLLDARTWGFLILAYCAVASLLPVSLLLQPRGYLGGFVLFGALAAGIVGIAFGGYEIRQPAFRGWDAGTPTGSLVPFLFVTIACGACSGFHGLVCSGTTSKQLDREPHARAVGYGGMLAESGAAFEPEQESRLASAGCEGGLLRQTSSKTLSVESRRWSSSQAALSLGLGPTPGFLFRLFVALVTVMIARPETLAGASPGRIYGEGIGSFLSLFLGRENLAFAVTFGAMAFSTFVFDTLDVCTRLGRYILQEALGWRGRRGAIVATLLTIGVPALVLAAGREAGWSRFWTLFGASNQLLAALALLAVSVWLGQEGRRMRYTLVPALFVGVLTVWALVRLATDPLRADAGAAGAVQSITAAALLGLALFFSLRALSKLKGAHRRGHP